jgi:hypothetical protein
MTMQSHSTKPLSDFAKALCRFIQGSPRKRIARKRVARARLLEQLEARNLMALDIIGLSPADGAINWPLNTDLAITFDEPVFKGQGNIHVVSNSTGTLGVAIEVNDPMVTIVGNTVNIDLPADLLVGTDYHILIDNGAFRDGSGGSTAGATLLQQNFDLLPLSPFITEGGGDGTDFTLNAPLGFSIDNSTLPAGGVAEWAGWSFADKQSWINQAGDQSRSSFTLGSGTIAVGDPDEYDDSPSGAAFDSKFLTRPIKLDGVAPNSVVLEFDSSFRPEDSQVGTVEVTFDGGLSWNTLLTLNPDNTSNTAPSTSFINKSINEHLVSNSRTGISSDGLGNALFDAVNNPVGATSMQFRFSVTGANDWWWGIDNVKVTGTVTNGVPFTGITDPQAWNLDIARLSVAINPSSMSENGGTATGTVTRNGPTTSDLVVNLTSGDTTEASVPTSVTILAGSSSANFTINGVDDLIADRRQTATITATAATFANGVASIDVLDDEGPKVLALTPADGATGVNYQSNLLVTFDTAVKKGHGSISIVRASDNVVFERIDVRASNVTVAGAVVTINPTGNLPGLTDFYVLIDDGAFLDQSLVATPGALLLSQNFEGLSLNPFTTEVGGDGTDFTNTPPVGFSIDNAGMPGGSVSNFDGWTFVDKNSWLSTSGLGGSPSRGAFTNGNGIVAVADAEQWNEIPHAAGSFNSYLRTAPIDLSEITAGSVALEFDFGFDASLPRLGVVDVTYDGGASWTTLLQFDASDVPNGRVKIDNTGVVVGTPSWKVNDLVNPANGTLQFRFGLLSAVGGWFAVDNLRVTGGVTGIPSQGISSPTTWNFTTAEAPTLTVTTNVSSMNEVGGLATGTVTRNLSTAGPLTVSLTSSDTSEATVPLTITIPAGQASVTFPITAVDDAIFDKTQTAIISASFVDFFSVPAAIDVIDNDFVSATSFSPADNMLATPVGANLTVTFDQPIKKGNGFVHIIRADDDKAELSIDINSSEVTISGSVVTINPSSDLKGLTDYYIRFEDSAILSNTLVQTKGALLLSQDFELLTLQPAVFETVGIDGTDFTATPPTGYSVDNSQMSPGGVPEWNGWTFVDKNFWIVESGIPDGQRRIQFTKGSGTIAVGDPDEFDDRSSLNRQFNSLFISSPIDLSTVASNSVQVEFDSSFRPEDLQTGKLDVSYDGGASWSNLLTLDSAILFDDGTNINEHRTLSVSNPGAGSMQLRWGVVGLNNWWWAIDNIKITGDVAGLPYVGISDTTSWNFTTAEAQTLNVSLASSSIAENSGATLGTVTRNLGTTGPLVVSLTSSNPSIATVPATVTILDGQSSATFPITPVNTGVAEGSRVVTISATASAFVNGSRTLTITDDEVPSVVITEIMYNPAGSEPRTEWIEVYNRGSTPADLSGWSLDDEDTSNWGAIPAGTILQPGQVGVVYNSFFAANTDTIFRTEWNVPVNALVVGVFWGLLDNNPNAVGPVFNEGMLLKDSSNAVIDRVNFDDSGTWPANVNGTSIYLSNPMADNNVGSNWLASVVGVQGGTNPAGPPVVYNAADIGSPGSTPVTVAVAPRVASTGIGDGSVQRSMIQTINVNFDGLVNLDPNAFLLEVSPIGGGGAFAPVAFTVNQSVSVSEGRTVATLTFSGPGILNGSLPDGNYRVTALSSKISNSLLGNLALDGDNNGSAGGNAIEGESATDNFFRLYGDTDGNGIINPAETNRFRRTVGRASGDALFNPLFDFDGNGFITPADTNAYRQRVGRSRGF